MRYLLPLILILASVGMFILYVNPAYTAVKDLRTQEASYNEALSNSKKLQAVRDVLVAKYNSFSPEELARLSKMLPDNVDNIKLILEIDKIASQYGMKIKNIKYDVTKKEDTAKKEFASQVSREPVKDYGAFDLEFSIEGSYSNFSSFLQNLEKSLRIVDVESISFTSDQAGGGAGTSKDVYKYDFKIKTYWLKG